MKELALSCWLFQRLVLMPARLRDVIEEVEEAAWLQSGASIMQLWIQDYSPPLSLHLSYISLCLDDAIVIDSWRQA